ncbi:hypothetical protein B0H19DRAFT_1081932 [Mycena capillaripes]|nr:hypothetical protein B0H19DRAFT_1081932 [Mycena capillaripes]
MWHKFFVGSGDLEGRMRETPLQLHWSSQVPLSISLSYTSEDDYPHDVLKLFIAVSSRWQNISLDIDNAHYKHFFSSTCNFPVVRTLDIRSWDEADWPAAAAGFRQFLERLPALEELTLEMPHQLIRVAFFGPSCVSSVGWRIYYGPSPLFFRGERMFLLRSPIWKTHHLGSITTPSPEELAITRSSFNDMTSSRLASTIIAFLRRSSCALTSLRLHVSLSEDDLCNILDSAQTRGIVHLDVCDKPRATISKFCIDTRWLRVASSPVLFRANLSVQESSNAGGGGESTCSAPRTANRVE